MAMAMVTPVNSASTFTPRRNVQEQERAAKTSSRPHKRANALQCQCQEPPEIT